MTGDTLGFEGRDQGVALDKLPKNALQAIYHAVTGKTENLAKIIDGNVIIRFSDFDRLYSMIFDQTGVHTLEFDPTTTIVVKHANEKSVTYSSWERFKALQVNNHEVTSEITLKMEFVLISPGTKTPQRLIITVNLDSSLPILDNQRVRPSERPPYTFWKHFGSNWRTVDVSIDFVDFLVAKSFVNVVEEWFLTLDKPPKPKANTFIFYNFPLLDNILGQFGRIGMAIFLSFFVYLNQGNLDSLGRLTLAVSVGLAIWSIFLTARSIITKRIFKRVTCAIIPTVILLNDGDEKAYKNVLAEVGSPALPAFGFLFTVSIAIGANLLSSYIFDYLTR